MDTYKIKITIEYDGTNFYGWQRQPKLRTVQGEIVNILSELARKEVLINGSGRTDAGVHALAQVASFEWDKTGCVPVEKLQRVLNNRLPNDICIRNLEIVDDDFHARFSAIGKMYKYTLFCSDEKEPIISKGAYVVPSNIDIDEMKSALSYLEGKHDFKSFMASGSHVEDTVREIYDIDIVEQKFENSSLKNIKLKNVNIENKKFIINRLGNNILKNNYNQNPKKYIHVYYTGNGFLYNMVRIMTGLLVDIGLDKKNIEDIPNIIAARDRTKLEHTAPACGLYLMKVYYGDEVK